MTELMKTIGLLLSALTLSPDVFVKADRIARYVHTRRNIVRYNPLCTLHCSTTRLKPEMATEIKREKEKTHLPVDPKVHHRNLRNDRTYGQPVDTLFRRYPIIGTYQSVFARYAAESGGWPCPFSTYLRQPLTRYIWEKRARQEHSPWSRKSRRATPSVLRTLLLVTTRLTCTSVFTNGTFLHTHIRTDKQTNRHRPLRPCST